MNRKILHRFCAAAALFAVLSSQISFTVSAAGISNNATIPSENVPPSTTEAPSIEIPFPDVRETDWFCDSVIRLTEEKILHGCTDGLFHPELEITNAEFVKLLIESLDIDISEPLDLMLFSDHWASSYISYAYKSDIITDNDLIEGFDPSAPITRADMTRMMILSLGIEPVQIDAPFTDSSDIYANTAYKEYLLRGYLLDDDTRIYDPEGNALRCEAVAIIVRILEYMEDAYAYKRDAILDNAATAELNTESELIDLFYILNREFMTQFTFKTKIPYETWANYYRHANVIQLEHFYSSYLHCSYISGSNTYNITLEYRSDIDQLKQYYSEADKAATDTVAAIIDDSMSENEKIKAIHDYIILNCAYDYDNYIGQTIPFEARLAYGALCQKSAVCQGYTAAFNLLCKKAGIRSVVVTGSTPTSPDVHAWNMVLVDGKIFYIDTTHDDPVPDKIGSISYKYFMLSADEMIALGYNWDKSQSNIKYFY